MFRLSIVTPEKVVYEGEISSLIVPGIEGYLGILSHHAPLITALQTGKIEFKDVDNKLKIYAVSGGFIEVSHNQATLLADTAEHADEINVERAQTAIEKLSKALADGEVLAGGVGKFEHKQAIKRAENRLKIYKETH
ncbi:MAG: ATP synthase F1 subunit epsilon [Candidatus Zixiibacteriota bacterium]